MSESAIAARFAELRARRRPGLVAYLTAGHPTPATSREAIAAAGELADVLEVGIPFSDPLADGPVIQRASFEAIRQGMSLERALDLVQEVRPRAPVVIFSYLNPVLRFGIDRFLARAVAAGAAGVLLTDLPAGGDPTLEGRVQASSLDLIRLVAPTTSNDRMRVALQGAQGFVYLISRLGVTGARAPLPAELERLVARVRTVTTLPIAVGFGVSSAAQVAQVGRLADGVVVGSALVDRLESGGVAGARELLHELREALAHDEVAV